MPFSPKVFISNLLLQTQNDVVFHYFLFIFIGSRLLPLSDCPQKLPVSSLRLRFGDFHYYLA